MAIALTTNTSGEGEIRKALVERGLDDCIVNLPTNKIRTLTQIRDNLLAKLSGEVRVNL